LRKGVGNSLSCVESASEPSRHCRCRRTNVPRASRASMATVAGSWAPELDVSAVCPSSTYAPYLVPCDRRINARIQAIAASVAIKCGESRGCDANCGPHSGCRGRSRQGFSNTRSSGPSMVGPDSRTSNSWKHQRRRFRLSRGTRSGGDVYGLERVESSHQV
jgi:hypothetical protein